MNQSLAWNAEPPFGLFEIVKGFDPHSTVHGDGLTKSFRIKHRLQHHIGKARHRDSVAVNTLGHYVCHELAVIKTLKRLRITYNLPGIYQHLFQFVTDFSNLVILQVIHPNPKLPGPF